MCEHFFPTESSGDWDIWGYFFKMYWKHCGRYKKVCSITGFSFITGFTDDTLEADLQLNVSFCAVWDVAWCLCPHRETSTITSSTHSLHSHYQNSAVTRPRLDTCSHHCRVLYGNKKMFVTDERLWIHRLLIITFTIIPHSGSRWSPTPAPCWLMVWPSAWHLPTFCFTWAQRKSVGEHHVIFILSVQWRSSVQTFQWFTDTSSGWVLSKYAVN